MVDTKLISFLSVAEHGSFTKASQVLNLTQPAVSTHVRQLEKQLGVRLFERIHGSIRLTQEGETVLRYARRMQALTNNLQRDLQSNKNRVTSLVVGITHTAESNAIAEALAQYTRAHNDLRITIMTDTNARLKELLKTYDLDLAVIEGQVDDPTLKHRLLDTDSLALALSPDHPLAQKDCVSIDALRQERMILRLPDSNTRNLFTAALEERGMSIRDFHVILEVNNIATIKDLVRGNFGVSVLARSACANEYRKHKIVLLPIEGISLEREINLVCSKDFQHADLMEGIAKAYREVR